MDEEKKTDVDVSQNDSVKKNDDVLEKAFAHPVVKEIKSDMMRYKDERNQLRSQLEEYKKKEQEVEVKRLEEEKKYKELFEAEKKAREELVNSLKVEKIRNAINGEAVKVGAINPNDANFLHLEGVSIGEDGNVTGVTEAIEKIKTEKPYLFASAGVQTFGQQPKKGDKSIIYQDLLDDAWLMSKYLKTQPDVVESLKQDYLKKKRRV